MSEKLEFQYAVLRYIHDIVTGEFLNVGLVIYSKQHSYFRGELLTRYRRITSTFPGADGDFFRRYLNRLQIKLEKLTGQVSSQQSTMFDDLPDRLDHLLTLILPKDDGSVQFTETQVGLANDLDKVFTDLYHRLVTLYIEEPVRFTRDDDQVWNHYSHPLRNVNILGYLQPISIITPKDEILFDHGWKNGKWNLLQPLSFDLSDATYIRRKARLWLGTNIVLNKSDALSSLYYLLGKPRDSDRKLLLAYQDAIDILLTDQADLNFTVTIIEEDQAEDFAQGLKPQIEADLQ